MFEMRGFVLLRGFVLDKIVQKMQIKSIADGKSRVLSGYIKSRKMNIVVAHGDIDRSVGTTLSEI